MHRCLRASIRMSPPRPVAFACLLVALLATGGATAADRQVQLVNPGFESAGTGRLPAGWALADPGAAVAAIARDDATAQAGTASLAVRCERPGSVTLHSEPVTLEIGRLYRLSGWIRTEAAFADPTSRYPTAVPATLSMASFPFTNHAPAVGATRDWTRVETLFLAVAKHDRVAVHLGRNGTATGAAWFDSILLEEVDDIAALIPPETVRWFGPAYRWDDRGWIHLHVEGEPYERGYQHGALLADEIVAYMSKLAVRQNGQDPAAGWDDLRFLTDAIMLRKYDPEYQTEMRGIADGASHAGARWHDRRLDLVDVAVLNSVIDLGQMKEALRRTPNATTGMNFLKSEDELLVQDELHKCSSFAATGAATRDGRFVFGQIFMWNGYTGVHWNVLADIDPSAGHRFVQQTFPGGIHSGADFYINEAGLVIGETTVAQTPYDQNGTPQSNRIRRAVQYGDTIDDVVRIMTDRNNGQYTNEWPFADAKNDEIGIFLLGTAKWRLWRSSAGDFPGGLADYYWCNNNAKDLEVRKEYVATPDSAPFDLTFRPWNRDLSFNAFYREMKGAIDHLAAVDLWASSPINRAHACDGKVTTADMAEKLVFLAHHGKVTLREKMVGSRFIPDLPGAEPHLSLGYSVASPIFVTAKLQATRAPRTAEPDRAGKAAAAEAATEPAAARVDVDARALWRGTVYPASPAEAWLVSGSAAYWRILEGLPEDDAKAQARLDEQLAELANRYLYTVSREDDLAPLAAEERFDRYAHYEVPRIKGTFALHQLRLWLGNDAFLRVMRTIYEEHGGRDLATADFLAAAERLAGRPVAPFVRQWLERTGLPAPRISARARPGKGGEWVVTLDVAQPAEPYHFLTTVDVACGERVHRRLVEVSGGATRLDLTVPARPTRLTFNAGTDVPVAHERFYTLGNFIDDFHSTLVVYGTAREVEANHTLAARWQETLADAYAEILPPLRKDCEVAAEELAGRDLMVLGAATDNTLAAALDARLDEVDLGRNLFRFRGTTYARADDGLVLVLPNPHDPRRVLYLVLANSAAQLERMTRKWQALPSWAVFRGAEVVDKGYHPVERLAVALGS